MKKILAAASALLLVGAFAFAEGYLNANDLEKGQITEVTEEEDGFVLNATADKAMTVDSAKEYVYKDESFTQRIKLNGKGTMSYRSISFPAKKGENITIYGISGSKTEARPLAVVNEAGEEIASIPMNAYNDDTGLPTVETVKAPADGTYTIYSKASGINIYQIKVGK